MGTFHKAYLLRRDLGVPTNSEMARSMEVLKKKEETSKGRLEEGARQTLRRL